MIPIPATKVHDRNCQLNWEFMQSKFVTFKSTGPVTGSGGAIAANGIYVDATPSKQLLYTTPSNRVKAQVSWIQRWDSNTAAWNYIYMGLTISPTPLVDYDASNGGNQTTRLLFNTFAGAATYAKGGNVFMVDLAANTAYTFSFSMTAGAGGGYTWIAGTENKIDLMVFSA